MTQNQLKYWELRWKQHYEKASLKIDQAKIDLEVSKLAETIRHNKKQEKIETQRMIHEGIKIRNEWEKLSFDMQAKVVELGLKANRDAAEILTSKFVAAADFVVAMTKNKDQSVQNWVKIYKETGSVILDAFGGQVLGLAAGEVRGLISGSEYDRMMSAMLDTFPEIKSTISEYTGLKVKTDQFIQEKYGPAVDTKSETKDQGSNLGAIANTDPRIRKFMPKETNNGKQQTTKSVSGFSNTDTSDKFFGTSVQMGKSGSTYYSKHDDAGSTKQAIESKTSNGTSVIYSPGSHYGPGYI